MFDAFKLHFMYISEAACSAGLIGGVQMLYLCSSCDHVWDEISVSWSIHQCHNFRCGLKLGHAHVHGHTPAGNIDGRGYGKKKFRVEQNRKEILLFIPDM